ncbi:MAG: hypothetical protein HC883_02810 [Bdellovibrionaceae bacterium]|nr:hypothetical protein [Pseudobdellovibrionaceae bacterium]
MEGLGLLKLLIESTGLPTEAIEREINRLVAQQGLVDTEVTLDDVRDLLSAYLQETLVEAKNSLNTEAAG